MIKVLCEIVFHKQNTKLFNSQKKIKAFGTAH